MRGGVQAREAMYLHVRALTYIGENRMVVPEATYLIACNMTIVHPRLESSSQGQPQRASAFLRIIIYNCHEYAHSSTGTGKASPTPGPLLVCAYGTQCLCSTEIGWLSCSKEARSGT